MALQRRRGAYFEFVGDLELDPPPGIVCYPIEDNLEHLEAYLDGPSGSPYEGGQFQLDIVLPERYPFEPPRIKYNTPIYHPNIDDQGRICADVLKSSGAWRPSMTLSTTLMSLHTLMADPNPEDPLDADIVNSYSPISAIWLISPLFFSSPRPTNSK
ncbi:ubiquitin-conjugating enzyme/RWD-like protein [Gongronella butleri]|nr:ubiquitin-conjugating enzyme/RWD-like protein [Gongronella butleri]